MNNKEYDIERQNIIIKEHSKYYNKENDSYILSNIVFKELISKVWELSKILNKHRKEEKPTMQLLNLKQKLKEVITKDENKIKQELKSILDKY